MKRVAVLMGGPSAEREVSLVSGKACAEALRAEGYDVTTVDVGRDVSALIAALEPRPDTVFNALHGRWGEDGCVQGVLDLMGIPYTHSGLLASALAMDKPMAKRVFAAAGIRCPGGRLVTREEFAKGEPMARPYVMKPYNEGSSVGVRIVRQGDNMPPLAAEWPYGLAALVEPFIAGRELTVAVMGDRPLAVTELISKTKFYDYEAKYTDGITQHLVPAPLPPAVYEAALANALAAHRSLGCRGVSRSDFRYDDTQGGGPEQLYLLEVNTQPGMTPLSLAPEQAKHVGISFRALVSWMVENAQCDV
ncbi:D-alanine--D-alanine ligase [Hypericibacter sp.]|uniref:D-alanine--D-alanine ligase n=1 Tax=Hypericibacter sp. TaxID=2705401 RepID=UPI003D6DA443